MSIEQAKSRILRSASEEIEEGIAAYAEHHLKRLKLQSPIEELFLIGIIAATFRREDSLFVRSDDVHTRVAEWHLGETIYALDAQVKVDRFRVDFVLQAACANANDNHTIDLQRSAIVVECDGAKFHHGDPVSAARDKARDRVLAEHYDAVLRFTGAELYANAFSCAKQALAVAEAKLRVA